MGQAQRKDRRNTRPRDIEMWEISRDSDSPRIMRLADPESRRPERKGSGDHSRSVRPIRPVRYTEHVERKKEAQRIREARAAKRRKAKRRRELLCKGFTLIVVVVCLVLIYQTAGAVYRVVHDKKAGKDIDKNKGIVEVMSETLGESKVEPPAITEDFLEINEYSRPGTKLNKVKSIFVHYTANPGTSAQQNRSYFANLAETHERSASAHFIIGYDGDVVQCIPLDEQAHAVISRNEDSLSIECCYLDKEDGHFTQETYDTLVHMLAWLTQEYHLSTDDILRHYDCGGKMCPLYYVEHEDAWEQLLADVENYEPENVR